MKDTGLTWIVAAAMLLLLAGCGSNRETDGAISGSDSSAAPLIAATVGLDVCTNCHTGQTIQWLHGAHGNFESIDASHQHIDNGMQNDGFPVITSYSIHYTKLYETER